VGPLPLLALAIAVLYFAREVLIPITFALTLTLVLSPAVIWLSKLHIRRAPAVFILFATLVVSASALGWKMTGQLIDVANELPNYSENISSKIAAMKGPTQSAIGRAAQSVIAVAKQLSALAVPVSSEPAAARQNGKDSPAQPFRPLPVQVVESPGNSFQYIRDLTQAFIAPIAMTGIVLIFTFFMLLQKEDLRNRLLRLVGLGQLNVMTEALDDATQRVSRYLLTEFLVNASFGLLIGTGLYFIGVPYAVLWGTVAALFRWVPYVGTLVAGTLPLLLSVAVFNSWLPLLSVLGLYISLELVIANVVEPWLYGAHTGISPLAILVAAVFWTILWGPAGLVLSTPLTVCLLVLGRYAPQLSFLQVLLGDEPVLDPQACLYQRLLAMDQAEAESVIDVFLKDHPLLELYDSVLIPALTLAEQDRHRGVLDSAREEFLFLSLNEIVAELPNRQSTVVSESSEAQPAESGEHAFRGRILCVPAYDQADEITGGMLAQFLEFRGGSVISFPLTPNVVDVLKAVRPSVRDIICICSLPPYAFNPARKMCKQLQSRFPKASIAVGVWGWGGDRDKARASFGQTPPDQLFTTFSQVDEFLHPPVQQTAEPVLVGASESVPAA
jgi:predicted PurR-regulated permease PerM